MLWLLTAAPDTATRPEWWHLAAALLAGPILGGVGVKWMDRDKTEADTVATLQGAATESVERTLHLLEQAELAAARDAALARREHALIVADYLARLRSCMATAPTVPDCWELLTSDIAVYVERLKEGAANVDAGQPDT